MQSVRTTSMNLTPGPMAVPSPSFQRHLSNGVLLDVGLQDKLTSPAARFFYFFFMFIRQGDGKYT